MSKFYTFSQNNSGGKFTCDPKAGISHYVIVEAESAAAANERAEDIGLYFDGTGDCSCCGDRWYSVSEHDADAAPSIYGKSVHQTTADILWLQNEQKGIAECYVHHRDGLIEPVMLQKR